MFDGNGRARRRRPRDKQTRMGMGIRYAYNWSFQPKHKQTFVMLVCESLPHTSKQKHTHIHRHIHLSKHTYPHTPFMASALYMYFPFVRQGMSMFLRFYVWLSMCGFECACVCDLYVKDNAHLYSLIFIHNHYPLSPLHHVMIVPMLSFISSLIQGSHFYSWRYGMKVILSFSFGLEFILEKRRRGVILGRWNRGFNTGDQNDMLF